MPSKISMGVTKIVHQLFPQCKPWNIWRYDVWNSSRCLRGVCGKIWCSELRKPSRYNQFGPFPFCAPALQVKSRHWGSGSFNTSRPSKNTIPNVSKSGISSKNPKCQHVIFQNLARMSRKRWMIVSLCFLHACWCPPTPYLRQRPRKKKR